ncbi:MAG: hypothetical protein KA750_01395 [Thermoflexales bacterium]|nr:hypothetical protein [Thermoflexales bacterium]
MLMRWIDRPGGRALPLVAGVAFGALYLALLTQQYIGDGMRWYGAMAGLRPPELGGSNHLLYPLVGKLWFTAGTALGIPASYALAQSMNAVLGGVALGFYCAIVQAWTGRAWLALAATLTLGLSRAFSQHGVDMTEPMPGVACVMAAIWLATRHALRPGPRGRLLLAGALLGLGGAIYQANILAVFGACALVGLAGPARGPRARWIDAALVGLAAGVTAAALYLSAFMTLGGARTLGEAFALSLETESARTAGAYAEISLRRVGVLIFGLADSLYGIRGVDGLGTNLLARGLTREVIIALVATGGGVIVPGGIAAFYALRRRAARGEAQDGEGRTLLALLIWLVPQLGLALYFGGRYSKLWMLSLAVILLMLGLMLAVLQRRAGRSPRVWRAAAVLFAGVWVLPVGVMGLAANLIPDHLTPQACAIDAGKIDTLLKPQDLLISDWGGLACAPEAQMATFSLAASAFDRGLVADGVRRDLDAAVAAARARGGAVYVLGLLDLSADEWEPFLGQRLHLPFAFLAPERARAVPSLALGATTPQGAIQHLWQVAP